MFLYMQALPGGGALCLMPLTSLCRHLLRPCTRHNPATRQWSLSYIWAFVPGVLAPCWTFHFYSAVFWHCSHGKQQHYRNFWLNLRLPSNQTITRCFVADHFSCVIFVGRTSPSCDRPSAQTPRLSEHENDERAQTFYDWSALVTGHESDPFVRLEGIRLWFCCFFLFLSFLLCIFLNLL